MPRYLFFERKNAQFGGGGWGGEGQMMFSHTFLTTSCKLYVYGKHGLTQLSAVISNYKTEHGAIFKRYSLNCFLPRVIVGRALSINVPSGGIPFVLQAALCQNSSCFHFIWDYLRSLSSNHNVSSLFCVFFYF